MYKSSKSGILSLTEDFEIEPLIKSGRSLVKEFFSKNTLAIPNQKSIPGNTVIFLNWLLDPYYALFEEKIGFSKVPFKLWPGADEAETLLIKIAEIAPGLLKSKNPETNEMEDTGLRDGLKRRLHNNTDKRKLEMGSSAGNI